MLHCYATLLCYTVMLHCYATLLCCSAVTLHCYVTLLCYTVMTSYTVMLHCYATLLCCSAVTLHCYVTLLCSSTQIRCKYGFANVKIVVMWRQIIHYYNYNIVYDEAWCGTGLSSNIDVITKDTQVDTTMCRHCSQFIAVLQLIQCTHT